MNENLQNLFADPQVQEIIAKAMESLQAVSLESDTLKVTITPENNSFSIQVEYKPVGKLEAANFKDYLKTLPDEVFTGVCEMLGQEKIAKISKCLESNEVEVVRAGIVAFKNAIREYAIDRIKFYKDILNNQ